MNEMQKVILTMVVAVLATSGIAQGDCGELLDANQDGLIGVEDLMNLLSHFGDSDLDYDGVFDSVDMCLDMTACNYAANPTEECAYLDVVGICGGGCTEDANGDGICDWTCGVGVLYQGYVYSTVEIGNQCWFAENLRAETYLNGDSIPGNLSNSVWEDYGLDEIGAFAVYEGDPSMINDYGLLYNGHAVGDTRGLCPTGWTVASDSAYSLLEIELGMSHSDAFYTSGWLRGSDEGLQMKASPNDSPVWNGSNLSGFTGQPGGFRSYQGEYHFAGYEGRFWTSTITEGSSYAYFRALNASSEGDHVYRATKGARMGMSVRCLQE